MAPEDNKILNFHQIGLVVRVVVSDIFQNLQLNYRLVIEFFLVSDDF